MGNGYPTRDKLYIGPMTNSAVWGDFQLRDDDVIVSTPPKCGTTWTQAIVAMLIFGRPGMDIRIGDISPWLDCGFRDRAAIATSLSAQTYRRCIKSHSPFDGISYDPSCTYLAVYRHPMDVHFSMRRHVENLQPGLLNRLTDRFPEDLGEGFRMFVEDCSPDGGNEDMTLDSIVYHYLSFKKWAHLPNVHLFHYSDLGRDLEGQVARLASILGYDHPPAVMQSIVEGARFDAMRDNAKHYSNPKRSATFKDSVAFFASGTSEKWRDCLNAEEIERYRFRMAELLTSSDTEWIENGTLGQADG